MEAQDLDKEDLIGKSDPLVEVWTQQSHIETTVSPLFLIVWTYLDVVNMRFFMNYSLHRSHP